MLRSKSRYPGESVDHRKEEEGGDEGKEGREGGGQEKEAGERERGEGSSKRRERRESPGSARAQHRPDSRRHSSEALEAHSSSSTAKPARTMPLPKIGRPDARGWSSFMPHPASAHHLLLTLSKRHARLMIRGLYLENGNKQRPKPSVLDTMVVRCTSPLY